jgi:hypothetical protein
MALSLSWGGAALGQTQAADPDFRPEVARPAYRGEGPIVAIDRAHHNFHTATAASRRSPDCCAPTAIG